MSLKEADQMAAGWCEHLDMSSKYTLLTYRFDDREITLRVQTWVCPECGTHGSDTELAGLKESRPEGRFA
jgi:hypothetical protein